MAKVIQKNLTVQELFGYQPSIFQKEFHKFRPNQPYTTLVAHRRWGKTEGCLMEMLDGAIRCPLRLPIFSYIAPTLKQAKRICWKRLKHFAHTARRNGLTNIKISESNTEITITRNDVGVATIYLAGWEEPESLRGDYCDGMVIDEAADMPPGIWGSILAPKLADRRGWAIITGTVKGIDQFYDFYNKGVDGDGRDPFWGSLYFPIEKTRGHIPWLGEYALNTLRSGMTEIEWDQEMSCNWSTSSENILIPLKNIEIAVGRRLQESAYRYSEHVLGVDVKGSGTDKICVARRWGYRFCGKKQFDDASEDFLAAYLIHEVKQHGIDAIFVDGTGGYAGSLMLRLQQLNCACPRFEIMFQSSALDNEHYYNIRAEMWDKMAKCIQHHGSVPDDRDLKRELASVEYSYKGNRLLLQGKDEIRKKLGRSPDSADSYALTFAYPVTPGFLTNQNSYGNKAASGTVRDDFSLR